MDYNRTHEMSSKTHTTGPQNAIIARWGALQGAKCPEKPHEVAYPIGLKSYRICHCVELFRGTPSCYSSILGACAHILLTLQ